MKPSFSYQLICVLSALVIVLSTFSCKREIDSECPACPVIDRLTPDHGRSGDIITLEGKNLGQFIETQDKVTISNQPATLAAAPTNSFLKIVVPENVGSGEVLVEINGLRSDRLGEKQFFTYDFVIVSDYEPDQGKAGDKILVFGKHFSPVVEENTVIFSGGTELDPMVAEVSRVRGDSILEVIVPEGGVSGAIEVEVDGHAAVGPQFSFTGEAVVSSFTPNHGRQGETISIRGENFANDPSVYLVTFGGGVTTIPGPTSTDSTLIVEIPAGAQSGNLLVELEGVELFSGDFIYDYPVLTQIAPLQGKKETIVTLTGNFFGINPDRIQVFFNETLAELVGNPTETQVSAKVPTGAGTGAVRVVVDGNEVEGPEFTYEMTITVSTVAQHNPDLPIEQQLNRPDGIALGPNGDIFVSTEYVVKRITPDGNISLLAGKHGERGNIDGKGSEARFEVMTDLTVNKVTGDIYVTAHGNSAIRRISPSGDVSTFAPNIPGALTLEIDKNGAFWAANSRQVFRVSPTGSVTNFAGNANSGYLDGQGSIAHFDFMTGITVDGEGNLYVGDFLNNRIRKINPNGVVSSLTNGDFGYANGNISIAQFNRPSHLTFDGEGNLLIVDQINHRIRMMTPEGDVFLLAGNGEPGLKNGEGEEAQFNSPHGIISDGKGSIYVADFLNNAIRKITLE